MFRDFDIFGVSFPPSEADAILIVDLDTVLSSSAAAQRLQPVAGRNQKIGERLRAIKSNQAPKSHGCDIVEFLDPLALEEPLALLAQETPDQDSS
jgi:hypothetical protein